MRRWFLSYHSADEAVAERLKLAVECKDSSARVFFAPTHMRAGGSWSAQLAREIEEATAFILLIGTEVGRWQVLEYNEALDKWAKLPAEFRLIVVLLEGRTAPGLPFLRQLQWIITPDPASEKDVARIFDAAAGHGSSPDALWRYTSPYRGLEAMEEKDSDYFFGRTEKTVEALNALAAPDRLPVLMGSSGVGKSSLAQAGVLAALKRQSWPGQAPAGNPWPAVFRDSRRWCYLSLKPGSDPLKALVGSFVDTWQFAATDPLRADHQHGWLERLRDGKATLSDLIEATERRRADLDQPKPPGFVLYVDQGEELYVRSEERQRWRFSELLLAGLADPRLRAMISMRSDFLGDLQKDESLFRARQQIDVPPLREAEVREVVSRPAKMLGAGFEPDSLVDIITSRTIEDSIKDVGALPLLSYTLDNMWREMVRHGDGLLRLPAQSYASVLVDHANRFVAEHPGAEEKLRRIFTLKLATVREHGEPTRRRAFRQEFSDDEWRLVSELADYPNRLLITAIADTGVTPFLDTAHSGVPAVGETYAEVAHEAIFRRWDKLRDWIAAEREFLIWRSGLERDRRRWELAPTDLKEDALLMGLALWQAQSWLQKRADDLPEPLCDFVVRSGEVETERRAASREGEIRRLQAEAELGRLRAEKEAGEAENAVREAKREARKAESVARQQGLRADLERERAAEAEIAANRARCNARRLRVAVGALVALLIAGSVAWSVPPLEVITVLVVVSITVTVLLLP
jgi:hypothetical protein